MAKYMQDSTDIQINEVSGTDNINFSFKSGNSIDTKIGDLTQLNTTNKNNLVGAINSIVESGSNANGNWVKFADGTMICTKKVTGQAKITATWGNLYDTGDNPLDLGNWAIPFIDIPTTSVNFTGGNGQWVEGFSKTPTKESAGKITIASATSKTANSYYDVIGIGKWR